MQCSFIYSVDCLYIYDRLCRTGILNCPEAYRELLFQPSIDLYFIYINGALSFYLVRSLVACLSNCFQLENIVQILQRHGGKTESELVFLFRFLSHKRFAHV